MNTSLRGTLKIIMCDTRSFFIFLILMVFTISLQGKAFSSDMSISIHVISVEERASQGTDSSPVPELCIIDPLKRKCGYDGEGKTIRKEIPDADYQKEVSIDESSENSGKQNILRVGKLINGQYTLEIRGIWNQAYRVSIGSRCFDRIISPGKVHRYEIKLAEGRKEIQGDISCEDIIDSMRVVSSLHWIEKTDLLEKLLENLQLAKNFFSEGNKQDALSHIKAFWSEIELLKGSGIKKEIADALIDEVRLLISRYEVYVKTSTSELGSFTLGKGPGQEVVVYATYKKIMAPKVPYDENITSYEIKNRKGKVLYREQNHSDIDREMGFFNEHNFRNSRPPILKIAHLGLITGHPRLKLLFIEKDYVPSSGYSTEYLFLGFNKNGEFSLFGEPLHVARGGLYLAEKDWQKRIQSAKLKDGNLLEFSLAALSYSIIVPLSLDEKQWRFNPPVKKHFAITGIKREKVSHGRVSLNTRPESDELITVEFDRKAEVRFPGAYCEKICLRKSDYGSEYDPVRYTDGWLTIMPPWLHVEINSRQGWAQNVNTFTELGMSHSNTHRTAMIYRKTGKREKSGRTEKVKVRNIWKERFSGCDGTRPYSFCRTSEGGYAVAVCSDYNSDNCCNFQFIKLGRDGKIMFRQKLRRNGDYHVYSMKPTPDGGYIICGHADTIGSGKIWVMKLDRSCTIQWDKTIGSESHDSAQSIQQTSDGGYILAGSSYSSDSIDYDIKIVKLDNSGNVLWNKTMKGKQRELAASILQTPEGGFIIAGTRTSLDTKKDDVWLIKTDKNGEIIWEKALGGNSDDSACSIKGTSDGGYIVAGNTHSYGKGFCSMWILKIDRNGKILWDRAPGEVPEGSAYDVKETAEGDYVVTGTTESYSGGCLLKLDKKGNLKWVKSFSQKEYECPDTILQISRSGFILAGETPHGIHERDLWIVQVEAE